MRISYAPFFSTFKRRFLPARHTLPHRLHAWRPSQAIHSHAFGGAHISRRAHSRFVELMHASIMPRFLPRSKAPHFPIKPPLRPAARISSRRFDNRASSRIPRTAAPFSPRPSADFSIEPPPESRPAASISAHINRISSRAPRTAEMFSPHSSAAFCPRAIPCRTVCTHGGRLGRFTAFFCRDAPPVRRAHISRRAHSRFAELMRASIMPRFLPHPSAAFSDRAAARISSRRFDKRTYQSHIQPHPETCRAVFHRASKRRIFRSNRRLNPIPNQPPQNSAFGRGAQKNPPGRTERIFA